MFSELEENKKVYDEDELEAEVMKLKQIHIREPGMEDPPPPPPCKKQKCWHNSRKKKRKPNEAFEKESNQIETEAVDPPPLKYLRKCPKILRKRRLLRKSLSYFQYLILTKYLFLMLQRRMSSQIEPRENLARG